MEGDANLWVREAVFFDLIFRGALGVIDETFGFEGFGRGEKLRNQESVCPIFDGFFHEPPSGGGASEFDGGAGIFDGDLVDLISVKKEDSPSVVLSLRRGGAIFFEEPNEAKNGEGGEEDEKGIFDFHGE